MKKFLGISTIASSALFGNIVNLNFFYQDYLDFGQNRGAFSAGKEGVRIREKNGIVYGNYSDKERYYDVVMPDFIGSTNSTHNKTFIGGSYVASAEHVFFTTNGKEINKSFVSSEMTYEYVSSQGKKLPTDRIYARYNKFLTSKEKPNLLEVTPNAPLDLNRYTHFWRAGNGKMYYLNGNTAQMLRSTYCVTGGMISFSGSFTNDAEKLQFGRDGVYFSNMSTENDSGSPIYAWDSYEREWVVVGFLSTGDQNAYTDATPHIWSDFEQFIKTNTNPTIYLNNAKTLWDGAHININNTNYSTTRDKDIIFRGGGTIDLQSNAIDQNYGGIYFDANQSYTITGTGSWKGGGLHIEKNTIVYWDINGVANDGLHKVGEGTLYVTKSNAGWLNLGEGMVVLDTESDAFDHYVLVSGRATLKLAKNKSGILNTSKLNFSERGGILDLNGNDLGFIKIRASDIGARIMNSSSSKSTITITNSNSDKYLYHGQIGDNIDIISDANNVDNLLAFDGSIDNPKGTLTHKRGGLLFQGHPYIHAYFDTTRGAWGTISDILGQKIYMTPTTLTQNDWEDRVYILKEIITESGSTFTLGRNATLLSDLTLHGTIAKFGGEAHVYVDRWDGEGANPHNSYKQELTGGTSQQDDSFFYEGNINLGQSSSIEVSNTSDNPLKFGNFLGKDKTTSALSDTNVHYTLSLDTTSNAKVKFMSLYGGESIKGIQPTQSTQTTLTNPKTLEIENLKVFAGNSIILGDITLSMQSYDSPATNPSTPKITFTNLQSQITLKDSATLSLSTSTLLQLQASNLMWENINYNTLYPLIISESQITDNRTHKDVEFIEATLPSFIITQTINEPQQISVLFSRNISQEIMKESSWLEKYASIIISGDTQSATIAEIENFQNATQGVQQVLSALLESNLEGEKVYQDIYLDTLIQKACNGDIAPLQSYLSGIHTTLKTSSRYGVSILATSLYNSAHYSSLKNNQSLLQNQIAFSQPLALEKRIRLAKNEIYTPLGVQSDYVSPPLLLPQENTKNNHLWADVHGNFLGGEQSLFYSMGLSGGYDYSPITQSDEFLSLGFSLHYAFAQYNEDNIQDTSHNIILGLHTQYVIYSHEMLFNLYGGSSIANNTNNSPIPQFNTTRADNFSLQAEGYYKYRFELKKDENIYHAIKPLAGIGYSHLFVPEENLNDFILISKVDTGNIFFKAGIEYNLATPQTQNTFSLTATYNLSPSYKREATIGTAQPIDYSTEIKPVWLELSYNGSYAISENTNIYYTLSTQFIPNSYYGVSGNIGGSWSF